MCFDPISYDKAEKARKHSKNVQEQLNQVKNDFIQQVGDINSVLYTTTTNVIKNGNFANGTTNWASSYASLSVIDNVLIAKQTGSISYYVYQSHNFIVGHNYYVRVRYRVNNSNTTNLSIRIGNTTVISQADPIQDKWYEHEGIHKGNAETLIMYRAFSTGEDNEMEVEYALVTDLTADFGEGNEPTLVEYSEYLSKHHNNWFDKTEIYKTLRDDVDNNNKISSTAINNLQTEVTDAHNSVVKGKTFNSLKNRLEESEEEILELYSGGGSWQTVENVITNDFDVNTNGWVASTVAPSGVSTSNVKVGTGSLYIKQAEQTARYDWLLDIPVGHKVYISSWVYLIEKPTVRYLPRLIRPNSTVIVAISINDISLNTWQRASVIGVMEEGARIRIGTQGAATGEYYTDGLVVIDITEEFGEGKEPTELEMDEMLSQFPNHFIQGRQTVKTIKEYLKEYKPPNTSMSIMKPEGVIVPEYVEFEDRTQPFSVGVDDALYGAKNNKIFMSSDALQTTVDGFDFATIKPSNVTWEVKYVTRTHSGYVVVISEVYGEANCRVFFSTSFTDGFTEVYNTPDRFWDVNFHKGGVIDQYGFICGYAGTLNHSFGLYMTKDGGQTWSKVYSTEVVNDSFVTHIHTAQYDPWTGNIFVVVGDGDDNRKFLVSENLGNTWEAIPTPTNEFGWTHLHQPTLVIPCKDKVVLGPDGAPSPCLYSITRDDTVRTISSHDWGFKFELGISDIASTAQWFPSPVYATTKTRNEAYAIFPQNSPREHYFIVGTGDGGKSWHTVYSLTVTGVPTFDMNKGLVGVDSNDFFYAYVFDGTKHYIAKFKIPKWVISQV